MIKNKKNQEKKTEKKIEKIANEMHKRLQEGGGEGGYFTELWKKLGDNPATNIKSFKFKKEILNAYSPNIRAQRFIIERGITCYIGDKEGIRSLKCWENDGFVWAHLIDLTELSKNHQDWWYEHLIDEE